MLLLIVEKDPLVRHWINQAAADHEVSVMFVSDAEGAIWWIKKFAPDCIVVDMASWGAASPCSIAELKFSVKAPVLLYSSARRWQKILEDYASNVDGVLAQPFTPDTIFQVAHLLIMRQARKMRQTAEGTEKNIFSFAVSDLSFASLS